VNQKHYDHLKRKEEENDFYFYVLYFYLSNYYNYLINKYFITYEKDFSLWRRKGKFRRINL